MKILEEGGGGKFNVIKIEDESHDIFQAKGYADATAEEYDLQEAEAGANIVEPTGDEPVTDSESPSEEVVDAPAEEVAE